MESYPLFPLSPSLTVVFAKRQIIAPKNIFSVVVLAKLAFSARPCFQAANREGVFATLLQNNETEQYDSETTHFDGDAGDQGWGGH
jgi:hypothetical protein